MSSFWCVYCLLWTNSTRCLVILIVDFEQINTDSGNCCKANICCQIDLMQARHVSHANEMCNELHNTFSATHRSKHINLVCKYPFWKLFTRDYIIHLQILKSIQRDTLKEFINRALRVFIMSWTTIIVLEFLDIFDSCLTETCSRIRQLFSRTVF